MYRLAIDLTGNVYIAGFCRPLYGPDYLVAAKYDANGNELWASPVSTPHYPSAITVDPVGNVYVSGSYWNYNYWGWRNALIKYDINGNAGYMLWEKLLDIDNCIITIDSVGNIYI
ncbi:MAG: SBBP repeat-containing protein [Deltaproteobacteria bacterium]|nr:SBBP repeat-containing protein [Deltaproteobacteria bacterium]